MARLSVWQLAAWQGTLGAIGAAVDSLVATQDDWSSLQQRHSKLAASEAASLAQVWA